MIRASIVGLGVWGQNLARSLQGNSEKIQITKGTTRTLSKAEDFAKDQNFALVSSYEDLLDDANIDAVVLATPHALHLPQIQAAAAAGKHIFVEKPITLYKQDSEAAAQAARDAGVVLAVGQNRRFHPSYWEMLKRIESGQLGTILHIEGNFSAPGIDFYRPESWRVDPDECPAGGMTGMGIHLIDAIIDLCGPIDTVYAQSFAKVYEAGIDDSTSVLMRLKSGASAYIGTSVATAWLYMLRIIGDQGWAEIQNRDADKFVFVPRSGEREDIEFGAHPWELAELEAFADAIGGKPYPVTEADFIHSTSVLRAVVESAEREERVSVP
jgi:predicted dehydrogenase